MNILFIHQNFPGQYKHLAPALATNSSNRVVAMHMQPNRSAISGVQLAFSSPLRGNTTGIQPWLQETETKKKAKEDIHDKFCQGENGDFP